MPTSAASGLTVARLNDSHCLLAVANFYGDSYVYQIDTRRAGLEPRLVQSVATRAAHDWEAIELVDDGGVPRTQLVSAEYDAARSLVYELNVSTAAASAVGDRRAQSRRRLAALAGWPACVDENDACTSWAASGECSRNAA